MSNKKTIVLGPEYDDDLWKTLKIILADIGATVAHSSSGHYGSQDMDCYAVFLSGEELVIESETYVGVSITGEAHIVENVSRLFFQKKGSTKNNREQ